MHQRDSGLYGEMLWTHRAWTVAGSGRVDWFQNYDGNQRQWNGTAWTPAPAQPPQFEQTVFDPRLGLSRKLGDHWAVSASGFRAFRAPTPSELYRSTQVGNQLTKPNGALQSERATGWETGLASQWGWGTIRTSYFLTQINRPISAVTINPNSSPILLLRENLGQIESKGVSVDFELAPRHWMAVDGGYQYAHATVTRGAKDLGNWIPEVARNMATLNVRAFKPRIGTLSLQSRMSGRQYDDDANAYLLHGYFESGRVWLARSSARGWSCSPPAKTCSTAISKSPRRPRPRWPCGRVARAGFNSEALAKPANEFRLGINKIVYN